MIAVFGIALLFGCSAEQAEDRDSWTPENEISWKEAIRLLNEGDVVTVGQAHSLWMTLIKSDGTTFHTKEPEIDAIFAVLDECTGCADHILVATE